VLIGAREIYDQLVRVAAAVERVSVQLAEIAQDVHDHETRLRSLERARWPLPSLAVLVSIAALGLALLKP
jgi:hypothetical protein